MKALLLVDIQNDFVPGGALAVPDGNAVIEVANRLMPQYELVVATQDWHPADHLSFASQHPGKQPGDTIELEGLPQVLWPDHCMQNKPGAELCPALEQKWINEIVRKGTERTIDSYSGFFDNGHRRETKLANVLRSRQVQELHIMGLATDYCVKFTALDARNLGFKTKLIVDGIRGVNLQPGDSEAAIKEMSESGVEPFHGQS